MHNKKRAFRALALALVLALLLPVFLPAFAENAAVIPIRNADDLTRLSRNCALDTWSQGKTVVLQNDIDLTGSDFSPIPTFGGTFEGGGHTISGLSVSGGVSYQGLFRYVQEGGVIRSLHVKGTVSAAREEAYLGGIAGSNEGTIVDCSFEGSVDGKTQVGGIAGVNEAAGSIYRCTASGSVTGEEGTGGIAGHNGGAITACTNQSAVNTVHQEKEQSLEDRLGNLNREELLDTTTDTGGIAGYSNGVLKSCRNEGAVGYPHVGYNVGGVVGRSSGYLEGCSNAGTIQGRKEVGGVAGQMAPNIRLFFSETTIDALKEELDRLNAMVNDTLDHTGDSKDTLSTHLEQLSGYTQTASDSVHGISNSMTAWADSTIDTVNDAASTLADTIDRLEGITANGEDILDTMADGIDGVEDSLNRFADAMGIGHDALDDIADSVQALRESVKQAQNGLADVRSALRSLSDAVIVEDQAAVDRALKLLKNGTAQLSDALEQCNEALSELARLVYDNGLDNPELREYLPEYLYLLADGFHTAADASSQIGRGILLGLGGTRLDWEQVKESFGGTLSSLRGLSNVSDTIDRSIKKLRNGLSGFADLSGTAERALGDLADSMDIFEGAARDLGGVADDIHALFQDLSNRDPIEFDKLGDDFHGAEDDLHGAVTGIGDQLDRLWDDMSASGDTLSDDLRGLGNQFGVITDLMLDAVSDTGDKDPDDLWDDVSVETINNTTLGKARGCSNTGAVEGDLNVGGIAGAMAIEYDFDPEDDITEVGEESYKFHYETRAILQDCVNNGAVTSKKDAAGGVVGRMELGYVLNCENYGAVESTSGDYTGGIAGISKSTIRGCWSKCALRGGSYVGGTAGYGCEIYQCVSMAAVEEAEGYAGSVAGDWDRENGALRGNRFVENELAGVDGVSYAGQAEPVAYADLMREAGVPEPFGHFTVTYLAEGEVVSTFPFSYGESLAGHEPPAVPAKEGYAGSWEDIGEGAITRDHVLEAVYAPYTTTLASTIVRGGSRALLLVEGTFDENAALRVEKLRREDALEQWAVTIEGADESAHVVRFLPPGDWKDASLRVTADGVTAPVSFAREGSYLVFTVSGSSFTLEAARGSGLSPIWLILAAALLAVLAVWLLGRRSRGQKPPAPPEAEEPVPAVPRT